MIYRQVKCTAVMCTLVLALLLAVVTQRHQAIESPSESSWSGGTAQLVEGLWYKSLYCKKNEKKRQVD